jgi:hypothetical protein
MRFKNWVVAIVATVVLTFAGVAQADRSSLGGVWVDGHSFDGQYGVNNKGGQSYGMRFSYEKDGFIKRISENNTWGIDYGVMLAWYRITITDNTDGRENWTIRHTNSLLAGAYPSIYIKSYDKVRFFLNPMAGAEFADDGESAPFLGAGIGIQYNFTKTVGLSLVQEEIFTTKRRFDSTSLNLVFEF